MADRNGWLDRFDTMFGELDGRLRHRKIGEVSGAAGPFKDRRLWEPIFCYCGAPGGYVTKGTPVRYVCMPCTEKFGKLPMPMVPGTENT
jgi:hypothetical protein